MFFGQLSDEELAKRATSGDHKAFESLYEKYFTRIYRFCAWQTHTKEDAEDIAQQVMIAIAESVGNFRGQSSFKNWVYAIAKNHVFAWIREKYKLPTTPLFETLGVTEHMLDSDTTEYKELIIAELMRKLKPQAKKVITLRYLRGYSVEETAKELHMSQSNVKVTTKRALELMAKHASCVTKHTPYR